MHIHWRHPFCILYLSGAAVVTKSNVHGGALPEEIRHYFLKREFSEGCHSVMHFKFPLAALLLDQATDIEVPSFRYCARQLDSIFLWFSSTSKNASSFGLGRWPWCPTSSTYLARQM
jgi:hypothetical protein